MSHFLLKKISWRGILKAAWVTLAIASAPGSILYAHPIALKNITTKAVITVKGKVTDNAGLPLPGVTVKLKGGTAAAATNSDGNYTIVIPDGTGSLVFSFIGYETKEVLVNGQTAINVTLLESSKVLQDVVVVGYGTQKKTDLTGSVSQVKASDINATSTSNIANALQGRAAGVTVTTSPTPGSSPTIRVRGSNSITAGNNPLIVLDGFPLENANLNDINSDDIATFDILKDASATAIYGSRGANGVIMITTKKGAAGQNNVTFSAYYGTESPTHLVNLISGQQFIDFINTAYTYVANKPVYGTGGYVATPPVTNTDWQRELMRSSAPMQNYNLDFSGGNEKTKYLLSLGTFAQDGLLINSGFNRYSLRTNLEQKVTNWFTVGTHLQVNRSVTNSNNPGIQDIFRYGFPTFPIRNADGSFYYATSADNGVLSQFTDNTRWNPVADQGLVTNQSAKNRILGDIYTEFKFLNHFTWRSNFGADLNDSKGYYYAPSTSTSGYKQSGSGSQSFTNENQYVTESVLTYDNSWRKHHLTATGVFSYQNHITETASLSGTGFPTDFTGYYNAGLEAVNNIPSTNKYSNQLMSYTTRASYSYADKYLLTVTGRWDGSSRFGVNNKWGFFPSTGLGWNVSNEDFMKKFENTISLLKLRGSVGLTGNQDIGNYQSLALQNSTIYIQGNTNTLLAINQGLGNPDLKWEKTLQIDVGVDLSLFNSLFDISADYYHKATSDLLYQVPIPTTSGYTSMLENIGQVNNKGAEVSLTANIIRSKSLKWSLGGNVSWNQNRIIALYGGVNKITTSTGYLIVGEPLNSIYAYKSLGVIQTPDALTAAKAAQPKNTLLTLGGEQYADIDGDGNITSNDQVNIGTVDPKFTYGLNTSISFKRFTLDVLGQGATGMAVNQSYQLIGDYQLLNRIYIPSVYAYEHEWSPTNTDGTYPRAGARNGLNSDRSNGNLKYFVVRNIRLGYTINPSWLKKLSVQNLNMYVNAQNFVTYSSVDGYNPENADVTYPYAKTLIFGLNLKF